MHIGFLTSEYIIPPDKLDGGLATYIQKVGRELVLRGHQVSVFCLSERNHTWEDMGVSIFEVDSRRSDAGFRLSRIFPPTKGIEKIFLDSNQLAEKVWEVHELSPINIVQSASWLSVGITLCHNGEFPLVCRISSMTPLLRNANKEENSISDALTDWCEIYQIDHADGVYAPSQLLAKYFSLFSSANPYVIPTPLPSTNEPNDDSFFDEELKGKKYILFFGSIVRMKGAEVLSRVIPSILRDHQDLHFVLIGRTYSDESNLTIPESLIEGNPQYSNKIHYYTSIEKKQLFPVIERAFAVVLPSLIDNYPNTCLEAQQFGRIVIGTKDSSLDEMIRDEETGFLVENNDPASLEQGIRRLLSCSPEQIKLMEANIRSDVDRITSEDRIGQLIHCFNDLISNYKPPKNIDFFDWQRIFLLDKFFKNFWIGILPESIVRFFYRIIRILLK